MLFNLLDTLVSVLEKHPGLVDRVTDRLADRLSAPIKAAVEAKLPDLSDLDNQILAKIPDLHDLLKLPEQITSALLARLPFLNGLLGGR